jgi:hypothetical protein
MESRETVEIAIHFIEDNLSETSALKLFPPVSAVTRDIFQKYSNIPWAPLPMSTSTTEG